MSEAQRTKHHETIRHWAEERQGQPATVKSTKGRGRAGILRIDFPGGSGEELEHISWDEFFETFDAEDIEFPYQEETDDGNTSRFCKFVSEDEGT